MLNYRDGTRSNWGEGARKKFIIPCTKFLENGSDKPEGHRASGQNSMCVQCRGMGLWGDSEAF